jgi:hypothetical protein
MLTSANSNNSDNSDNCVNNNNDIDINDVNDIDLFEFRKQIKVVNDKLLDDFSKKYNYCFKSEKPKRGRKGYRYTINNDIAVGNLYEAKHTPSKKLRLRRKKIVKIEI